MRVYQHSAKTSWPDLTLRIIKDGRSILQTNGKMKWLKKFNEKINQSGNCYHTAVIGKDTDVGIQLSSQKLNVDPVDLSALQKTSINGRRQLK